MILPALLAACAAPATCEDAPDVASDFLYGETVPRFRIMLSDEARAALPTRPHEAGEDVPATFSLGGESWEVGLDLRGHTSFRSIDGKAGFRLDFGEYVEGGTLHGVRRLTLDNLVGDPSGMAAHLAYALSAARGLPAPRHGYACVEVDGEDYGLYGVVETMDEQFLARTFDDPDGWLYDRDGDADLTAAGLHAFEVEEEGPGEAYDDLAALVDSLLAATEMLPWLDAHFDRDALLGALAVDVATGNPDGYARNANNFLLYHEPAPDRWWLLPWGADQAFQGPAGEVSFEGDRPGILAERCLAEASCAAALTTEVAALATPMEALAADAAALDARIADLAAADPKAETGAVERWSARDGVKSWIGARPSALGAIGP